MGSDWISENVTLASRVIGAFRTRKSERQAVSAVRMISPTTRGHRHVQKVETKKTKKIKKTKKNKREKRLKIRKKKKIGG